MQWMSSPAPPNGGLIVMSVAEPGSCDDLGSDEGGAYGCQTAGCQTWRRPRRSLERERPEVDLAPAIQELQATGCEFPTPHVPRLRVRERGNIKSLTQWCGVTLSPLCLSILDQF